MRKHETVERVSVSVPPELLRSFDLITKKRGFTDRSKAIQTAMRVFMSENEWIEENSSVMGAGSIGLLYNPKSKEIENALTNIQHHYEDIVTSSTHVHLNDKNCLETIFVRGETRRIKKLAKDLANNKGIKQVKVNFVGVI